MSMTIPANLLPITLAKESILNICRIAKQDRGKNIDKYGVGPTEIDCDREFKQDPANTVLLSQYTFALFDSFYVPDTNKKEFAIDNKDEYNAVRAELRSESAKRILELALEHSGVKEKIDGLGCQGPFYISDYKESGVMKHFLEAKLARLQNRILNIACFTKFDDV